VRLGLLPVKLFTDRSCSGDCFLNGSIEIIAGYLRLDEVGLGAKLFAASAIDGKMK